MTDAAQLDPERHGDASQPSRVWGVRGPIDPPALGFTLPHEHLIVEGWDHRDPNYANSAAMELDKFIAAGGQTIVDLSSIGLPRDPMLAQALAARTGVQVVMGTGYYKDGWVPRDSKLLSEEALERTLIDELASGIAGTEIRAGIIGEIGVSRRRTEFEERSLRAAAHVQQRIGCGLVVHLDIGATIREYEEAIDLLDDAGADLSRVAIGNIASDPVNIELCDLVTSRGCFVLFDCFGQERSGFMGDLLDIHPDVQASAVAGFLDRGFGSQMLLSHDVNHVELLTVNGGDGYAHIQVNVLARLREYHVSDDQIHLLTVDNPRRLLCGS